MIPDKTHKGTSYLQATFGLKPESRLDRIFPFRPEIWDRVKLQQARTGKHRPLSGSFLLLKSRPTRAYPVISPTAQYQQKDKAYFASFQFVVELLYLVLRGAYVDLLQGNKSPDGQDTHGARLLDRCGRGCSTASVSRSASEGIAT